MLKLFGTKLFLQGSPELFGNQKVRGTRLETTNLEKNLEKDHQEYPELGFYSRLLHQPAVPPSASTVGPEDPGT